MVTTIQNTKVEVIVSNDELQHYKTRFLDLGYSFTSTPFNREATLFVVYVYVDPLHGIMRPA